MGRTDSVARVAELYAKLTRAGSGRRRNDAQWAAPPRYECDAYGIVGLDAEYTCDVHFAGLKFSGRIGMYRSAARARNEAAHALYAWMTANA
jgi:hypothetical protein